jgi:hypothetical protein
MKRFACILFLMISVVGCRKPYNPPAIASAGSYLVVEGVINSGSDSTTIKLSRTVNVSSANTANPVLNATVAVQSDQNVSYPLTETTNGNYVSAGLNLDNTRTYRLSIKTPDNKQYQSDFVPVSITPPIDSIGFNVVNTPVAGIQIYANTHDATNTIKYYRWDYDEAWAFNSKYGSDYISNGTAIVPRTYGQNISNCYANDVSSDIVLGSSVKLKQDVLYQSPIVFIASTSEKIESEYSILLREYALTADAYNFWASLKTNTEQLGSIFDAQPSQLQGNIHCITNPSEPVIGYISVCAVSSKRVFIPSTKLPNWVTDYPYICAVDSVLYCAPPFCANDVYRLIVPDILIPIAPIDNPLDPLNPLGFLASTIECVDCTIRGSKTPPPFWK